MKTVRHSWTQIALRSGAVLAIAVVFLPQLLVCETAHAGAPAAPDTPLQPELFNAVTAGTPPFTTALRGTDPRPGCAVSPAHNARPQAAPTDIQPIRASRRSHVPTLRIALSLNHLLRR